MTVPAPTPPAPAVPTPEDAEPPTPEPAPAAPDAAAAEDAIDDTAEDANGVGSDDTPDEADDIPDDLRAARREAATRRKELRTVEAERDGLKGTVSALQRQVAEQLVAGTEALPYLHNPADLFDIGGVDVADLADESGGIDIDRLAAALSTLQERRPYLFGPRPSAGFLLFEAMQRQGMPSPAPATDTAGAWQKALKSN